MVEQIIAADHYELIQRLGEAVDPKEFNHELGWVHFKIKEVEPGVFHFKKDSRVFVDEWELAYAAASEGLFYGFVFVDSLETTLGVRAPLMMAEYVWENGRWGLREIDDFDIRERSVAEERFEISKDFEDLKKFLS